MDARDWIVRLTSGHASSDEIERFKAWRDRSPEHRKAFERERAFWQNLQGLEDTSSRTAPLQATHPLRQRSIGRRAFLVGAGTAATAGIAALAMPRIEKWWRSDFSTGIGEQAEFVLPDGSVAMLNTDSAIAVDFRDDLRLVELIAGEAEFRVQPSTTSLFRVAALRGNSDALGTQFSVRVVDDLATVTVIEGQVRVSGPANPTEINTALLAGVELRASDQTSYGPGESPRLIRQVDTELELAWRSGRLIFEGQPFSAALAEIGRYLPERIVVGPRVATEIPVTAIFSSSEAFAAVQALARTQGLTARRIPGVLVLIS